MSADFDVKAKLTMDSSGAFAGVSRLSGSMTQFGQVLQGNNRIANSIVGQFVGIAGTYVGLNAVKNVFQGLTTSAMGYTAQLETTKIGVQSILKAVEGGSWEAAGEKASWAFEAIKNASIKSPASAKEMFDIFTGILGPIEGAGFGLEKVIEITNDATLAASSLGEDYAQTSRDISMIARGTAGMDVKLFSLLRSTNAITESTEEWNKKLTAAQRVEKLGAALAKFRASGDAFGKSWTGVTSTFRGIREEMGRAAMAPVMGMLARRLGAANDYLLANQARFARRMEVYGERMAGWVSHGIDVGIDAFKWLSSHWVTIVDKVEHVANVLQKHGPELLAAAKTYAGVSIVAGVAGSGLQTGGALLGGAAAVGNMFGGGAAGAAGGAAATGGAAAVGVAGVAVSMGLLATMAPIVIENWREMVGFVEGLTGDLFSQMVDLGLSVWTAIKPFVMLVGQLTGYAVAGLFMGITTTLRLLVNALRWLFDEIAPISSYLSDQLTPAFTEFWQVLEQVGKVVGATMDDVRIAMAPMEKSKYAEYQLSDSSMAAVLAGAMDNANSYGAKRSLSKSKTTVTNDFRGSNIKIEQKFEGEEDPDRILYTMMEDLHKQAEMRLSSGYAGAFTR